MKNMTDPLEVKVKNVETKVIVFLLYLYPSFFVPFNRIYSR